MLHLSPRIAAGALVLTLTVVGTGLRLAAASGLLGETAAETRAAALPLAGKLVVAGAATINGKKALSGTTIFSENRIAVAAGVGNVATITLDGLGRLDLQPGTELVLRFAEGFIGGELVAGQAVVRNLAGVKVALQTPDGVVTGEAQDSAQQGEASKLEKVLTPQQMTAEAAAIVQRSQQLAEQADKLLGQARKEKDVLRLNCVNYKRPEINATTSNAETRQRELTEALAEKDQEKINKAFTVLKVIGQRLDSLSQEMSQCLGQETYNQDSTRVTPTVDSSSDIDFVDIITVVIPPAVPLVVIPLVNCNR